MRITAIIRIVDTMPKMEVYESRDNGKKTVGINLLFSEALWSAQDWFDY